MKNLFLANIAILALDVCLLSLEFAALWGVWCTFKGFAYSIKLKIEFAILNQLRETVTKPIASSSAGTAPRHHSSLHSEQRKQQKSSKALHVEFPLTSFGNHAKCFPNAVADGKNIHSGDNNQIVRSSDYVVSYDDHDRNFDKTGSDARPHQPSPSSSEIDLANRGA